MCWFYCVSNLFLITAKLNLDILIKTDSFLKKGTFEFWLNNKISDFNEKQNHFFKKGNIHIPFHVRLFDWCSAHSSSVALWARLSQNPWRFGGISGQSFVRMSAFLCLPTLLLAGGGSISPTWFLILSWTGSLLPLPDEVYYLLLHGEPCFPMPVYPHFTVPPHPLFSRIRGCNYSTEVLEIRTTTPGHLFIFCSTPWWKLSALMKVCPHFKIFECDVLRS